MARLMPVISRKYRKTWDCCGDCGDSYAECRCARGPTDSFHEVMRRHGTPLECMCCLSHSSEGTRLNVPFKH